MANGQIDIDVNLNKDQLQASMGGLRGELVKGMAVFEVLKQGVQKIAGMIIDSIDAAMKRIDTMDQFSRVMTTMTGSADKASAALSKTNEIVTGTAFGLDTAAKGVQAFVASGMEVSKATDTMGAWADAVAFYTKGTNAELETVSNALQKMDTKGNVTMEHLQMLLEAGIPAIQIYASAVGISTEEVTDQMSKGELKTSDFINVMNQAFQTGTAGFPAIAGAAKNAGSSWQGSIDNMKAAVARGTAAMLTSFDKLFNVKSGMVSFGKGIEAVLKGLANNLHIIIPLILGAVVAFVAFKIVQAIPAMIQAVKISIEALGKTLTTTTGIVGIIIAAVAAIIGVVDALSNSIDGWQKKLEDSNAKAQEQIQTNESLLESLRSIDTEYEKNIAQADNAATSSQNLLDRIIELQAGIQNGTIATEDQAAAQREISQVTTQLNSDVENLGLKYDETTNSLNMSTDAVEKAIDKQKEYQQAIAGMEQAVRLAEMQQDAEDELYMTKSQLADKQKELTDLQNAINWSAVDIWDWAKAVKKTTDITEGLAEQQGELDGELGSIKQRIQEALNGMAKYIREVETSQEISGQMTDEEIANIQTLIDAGGKLSEEDTKKFEIIKSNRAKEIVAEQDYIQAIKDGNVEITEAEAAALEQRRTNGEELTEIEQAKLDRWKEIGKEYKQSVSDTTDDIINSWKKLPDEYELSLDEMIEIGNENAERYAEWSQKMAYLSQYMSEESIAQLQQLGPGAMSVIDELIEGGSEKMAEFDGMMIGSVQGTAEGAVNSLTSITPTVVESFNQMNADVGLKMDEMGNILDTKTGEVVASAAQVLGGDALPEAARTALDRTGQVISENSDLSDEGKKTGDTFAKGYNANNAPVQAAQKKSKEVTQAIKTEFSSSEFLNIASKSVTDMANRMLSNKQLEANIKTVVQNTKAAAEAASRGWEGIGSNMVLGMASGVRNNVSILTSAIESVVKAAIQKAKDVAVIKSPSRVFADQVGYMLPAGIAAGVEKGTPVALDSIEKMTQAIIKTGNANAPIGTRDRAAEGVAAGVVNNFEQNNTIVNPPQTPGKMYRDLRRTGRQLINELG